MYLTVFRFLFFTLIALLSSCTTKDSLKKLLTDNPDILIDAIKQNPEKYAPVFNQVLSRSKQQMMARNAEAEKANREEQMKNPLKPEIDSSRAIKGSANAPVTIVAYSDFQCPYCSRAEATIEEVRQKYGSKVRYIFKNLPLSFHQMAIPAAIRYEAIALQSREKALKFHDEVFKNQPLLGKEKEAFLDKTAAKVGADIARMKKDMTSTVVTSRIEADKAEAAKFGITGTPGFLINGVVLKGARPVSDFSGIIDHWLNQKSRDVSSK